MNAGLMKESKLLVQSRGGQYWLSSMYYSKSYCLSQVRVTEFANFLKYPGICSQN